MFLLTFHYNFVYHRYTRSDAILDIVYVPIKWSLQFYAVQCVKSHAIPDIVYVGINFPLQFCVPLVHKI